jgi:cell division septation protein DedD
LGSTKSEGQNALSRPAADGWNVVPSPNTGSPHNYFYGVAAITSNDVWAVGGYGNLTTQAQQLIQHWDGQIWTFTTTPTLPTTYNELLAVSAVSANDVWAVGSSGGDALIEHWDGTSWQVIPNPNAGTFNRLFGVAAVSNNNIWAVGVTSDGGLSQTLVEHWNGASWSVIPSPNIPDQHNQLNAVTAVPGAPNELWAVGEAGPSALIMHWNGTQWNIVPSPNAGIVPKLLSVVAISANDVWAVGWTGGKSGPVTLTLHWDGSTWSVVPSPNPSATDNFLHGVTALGTNNVWAVGEFNAPGGNQRTLFLRWNGTAWEQVPGENTGPNGVQFFLSAVSAINGNDIWAVGNNSHSLAERWNGSNWSIVSTPNAGVGENILNGVSGSASNDVWQVGYFAFGTWKQTLIEHWNGIDWSVVPSPNTNNRLNELKGVVAISASNAWAVGNASSGQAPANQATLVLHWNGTAWSIIPSPSPGAAGLNTLYAVSANSANDVWAVGSYTQTDRAQTLVEHWDGTSWNVIPSPNMPDNNELYGVVAVGPNDVWAVGYWGHSSFGFSTLIEHWDGSSWSIVTSPNPSGDNFLSGVSATGANDVWAVGRSRNPVSFMTTTLIEHWDGNSWNQVLGFGVEPESAGYGVAAVSPGDAWAVGDGGGLALIGRWNGGSWSVFPSPNVTGRLLATTAITPCDVWAVGLRFEEGVGFLTLSEHFISGGCGTPSPTPTASPTTTPSPTATATATSSITPSPSPTATATTTPTSTPRPHPTPRPRPTPRATASQ